MKSMKGSNQSAIKKKNYFVKKLDQQVNNIQTQVAFFNERQSQKCYGKRRVFLRSLTQPKIQKKYQNQISNPEKQPIQKSIKFNKIFKNCSTITQFDFSANEQLLRSSLKTQENLPINRLSESIEFELFEKKKKLKKEWMKIEKYRDKNGIEKQVGRVNRRVNSILEKVKNNKPKQSIILMN